METPWDYNVTKEEQEVLTFPSQKLYGQLGQISADFGLYRLFSYRGQKEKAAFYFKRLPKKMPMQTQDDFDF